MAVKMVRGIVLISLLFIGYVESTQTEPWLGNAYEFEFRPSLTYQGYRSLASSAHQQKYSSDDFFLNASLSNSAPSMGVELEALGARTRRQKGDVDQIKLTGRYVWLDDITGDPLSVVSGLSYIQAFHHSLKDVSSFHHGLCEAEFFVSIGKELARDCEWNSRWWGVFGIGSAVDRGSPWLRFDIAYEKCFCEMHALRFMLNSLWGTGNRSLCLHHFDGYGPIQHQAIDLGVRYTYVLTFFGNASLEYSCRVHARNFPEYVHRVTVQILYTFGL